MLRFSYTKFWIVTGLKLLNKDKSIDVDKDSTLFIMKYFNKFCIIKYLELLVDSIKRPNTRFVTTRKKKSGMKLKDVWSSNKAAKEKQVVGSKFEYVEVAKEDIVMICLI